MNQPPQNERRKSMPTIDDDEEKKKIIKEAIDEWLNKQFSVFGRWTFYGILSSGLGALAYIAFTHNGWIK
jgi:hypothetical protein